jgi:hypothetical protein
MSICGKQNLITKNAGADLSALQYTFVKIDTTTNNVISCTSGVSTGILQNAPQLNEPAIVATQGSWSYLTSLPAGITVGDKLVASTGGKGTQITAIGFYGARAVSTTTQANSLVEVIVTDAYFAS